MPYQRHFITDFWNDYFLFDRIKHNMAKEKTGKICFYDGYVILVWFCIFLMLEIILRLLLYSLTCVFLRNSRSLLTSWWTVWNAGNFIYWSSICFLYFYTVGLLLFYYYHWLVKRKYLYTYSNALFTKLSNKTTLIIIVQ